MSPEAQSVQSIMDPIWSAELQLQSAQTAEEKAAAASGLNAAIETAGLSGAPPDFLESFFAYREAYREERDRSGLVELVKIIGAGVAAYAGSPLGILGYIVEVDSRGRRLVALRNALDDAAARYGVHRPAHEGQ